MTSQPESSGSSRSSRPRRRGMSWTIRITPMGVLLLAVFNMLILFGLLFLFSRYLQMPELPWQIGQTIASNTPSIEPVTSTASPSPTLLPSDAPTIEPSVTLTPEAASSTPQPVSTMTLNQGLIILALDEGANTHLFAYQPQESGAGLPIPLTRLTSGPWDDINPAISPDGQTVAFASSRSGYWDIYLLTISSGAITRLTDTLTYEGAPAWSPDNTWLVYETYVNDNLEIQIQSVVTLSDTVLLTDDPAADLSPVWSPLGRQIAFVSDRSGETEIWIADLDKGEGERFQDISNNPSSSDVHPAWSPDGKSLVWVSEQDGIHSLFLQQFPPAEATTTPQPAASRRNVGSGDWPVWSSDGGTILTVLEAPNHNYLTAYPALTPGLIFPTIELPGTVSGLSWGNVSLSGAIQSVYQQAAVLTPTAMYVPSLTSLPTDNGGRYQLIPLNGVEAPNPFLHDLVDESFQSLRSRIANESGWDYLSGLENAYVPLTSPLDPGMGNDWLYTGRAFALSTLPMDAGWLAVVREDFGAETYWRLYLKALYQDGSVGIPLHDLPWDFTSRNNGDINAYEQGGEKLTSIPKGYWIDFTARASSYGWERLPALTNWTASYPAARFNEFALTGGLDWQSAMLELYPPEVMITPTQVLPPTRTPTATLRWYVSPTPTITPSPRPTYTPYPLPTIGATPGG